MKTLTIVCTCGAQKTFRGQMVGEIIEQIDSAASAAADRHEYDWTDMQNDGAPMPKGHARGRCPACSAKADA